MNVTILTYVENNGSQNYDAVVGQVAAALRKLGHKASILGVHDDVRKMVTGIRRRRPDLIFNLMEMFGKNLFGDVGVVGLLDLLGVPYTGAGPGEMYLQQDKGLTKKLLSFDGISYPDFAVFSRDASLEVGGKLRMPLFIKPLRADASIGIDGQNLVRNAMDMMKEVVAIHEKVKDAALVEEYIEGREFYVAVLGNEDPVAFPPIEMDFSGLPDGAPRILGSRAKWGKDSAEYKGTRAVLADVPDELRARLHKVALGAYQALRVRDYGRVDLRLTDTGEAYVIEVNGNCYLERESEFAAAAAAGGIDYEALIARVAELALGRRSRRGRR